MEGKIGFYRAPASFGSGMVSKIILILLLGLTTYSSLAQKPSAASKKADSTLDELARYENTANNGRGRKNWSVRLAHYEIPEEKIWKVGFESMPKEIQDQLLVVRDGKRYIRFFIHPEDTWVPENLRWLLNGNYIQEGSDKEADKKLGKRTETDAKMTASRSLFLGEGSSAFSLKVGTNTVLGERQKKRLNRYDAVWGVTVSDYLRAREEKVGQLENFFFLRELAALGLDAPAFKGIGTTDEISMSVRDLSPISNSKFIYMPAFSVTDSKLGRSIASANGAKEPAKYWNEHLLKPVAKACAELFLRFGVTLDSLHGQNLLIEFKKERQKLVPTGRIGIRDVGDVHVVQELVKPFWKKMPEEFERLIEKKGTVPVDFYLLGYNPDKNAPSWLTPDEYNSWGNEFFQIFESELSRAGIQLPTTELSVERTDWEKFTKKFHKTYKMKSGWERAMLAQEPGNSCKKALRRISQ